MRSAITIDLYSLLSVFIHFLNLFIFELNAMITNHKSVCIEFYITFSCNIFNWFWVLPITLRYLTQEGFSNKIILIKNCQFIIFPCIRYYLAIGKIHNCKFRTCFSSVRKIVQMRQDGFLKAAVLIFADASRFSIGKWVSSGEGKNKGRRKTHLKRTR